MNAILSFLLMRRPGSGRQLTVCFALLLAGISCSTPAFAQSTGAVFVNGNSASNEVWMYSRGTTGLLSFVGSFATQGNGGGGLGSQGGVVLASSNRLLYAVDAGSNEISGFKVTRNGLQFVSKVGSGGTFPNSLAVSGTLLYVLNAQGTAANITGFRIQKNGTLQPVANSTLPLSANLPKPAQVGFTPDGKTLIVTEINTNNIDTYVVGKDGRATGPTVQASAGAGPFGFASDAAGHLIVSEVGLSSASSYSISRGLLHVITGALLDFGKAACWVVNTNDPNLPQQYSYVTNTGADTVSGFAIAADGSISLLDPNGKTAILAHGAKPLDMAISSDSKFLYVLEESVPAIGAFQIATDGSLTQIQDLPGIPATSYGMIGY
ncbi:MAG TPA: beta-propeller fold lactonase family protein [Chthoniobacterales bacterium]